MTSEAKTVSTVDLSNLAWRRSSRSGQGSGNNCVEVAFIGPGVAVRDSKNPTAGTLTFPAGGWTSLLHTNS
ncbi:MAG TPA: DUF397 domain-containing protein [Actinophytocola sp.]|jgi:hypothetical protein|uniref:DUF397 domain-containing protein n=1 Tax=Actinophytocola sp. TaxID=1872138 RepID=UPI002DFCE0E9|nr:DUF397 domain-containing protein [Actinophytocola sp.]